MTTEQNLFTPGKKPRAQLRMPQEAYVQIDQWTDYLGYEQYVWWRKFISWVDRTKDAEWEFHVPYTLEGIYKRLGVSQTTFYRKIKIIWEAGLIDFKEYGKTGRKTQKPKNIIVYDYPFNDAKYEYLELEKRRDWKKDYESESKLAGMRGAIKKKESNKSNPPNSERVDESTNSPVDNSPVSVDNPVDNSPVDNVDNLKIDPPNSERVDPPKFERVTLPDLGANHCTNNYIHITNKLTNVSNNSLSQTKIDLIQEQLKIFDFKEGERETIIELIINRGLFSITKQDIIEQAKYMAKRPDVRNRPWYFVNGLKINEGRTYPTKAETTTKQEAVTTPLPFYNWLEQ